MISVSEAAIESQLELANHQFRISRLHSFGLVIHGLVDSSNDAIASDYLHDILLTPTNRDELFALIEVEGLVVCRNVRTDSPSYRKVRGKSSQVKLSQAEYYHHDGCSSPTKPRIVEIRCPHQAVAREIATAISRFPDVIRAMLTALPDRLASNGEIGNYRNSFAGPESGFPDVDQWDQIQGKVTRLARREMDAESCRSYFREVDRIAQAYVLPWEMGESRLMLNSHADLTRTMQHRRAYQKPRLAPESNGSLVKRWTAEEI